MNQPGQSLFDQLKERLAAEPELAGADLVSLARLSVRLSTERVTPAELGMGQSRIGGTPDVPPDFEWPRWLPSGPQKDHFNEPWQPERPAPLSFIAQIDLSEMPRIDETLPASGWLYFFYDRYCEPWGFDPADRGSCRILYSNAPRSELTRADVPADAEADHASDLCAVEASVELTLPDPPAEDDDDEDREPSFEYGSEAYDAYQNIREEFGRSEGVTTHRFLGHPQIIQSPMERECQFATHGINLCGDEEYDLELAEMIEPGIKDWRLLLQIDSDEEGPGWMWGDVGRIYFWIKKQSLAELQFADAWLILQCG